MLILEWFWCSTNCTLIISVRSPHNDVTFSDEIKLFAQIRYISRTPWLHFITIVLMRYCSRSSSMLDDVVMTNILQFRRYMNELLACQCKIYFSLSALPFSVSGNSEKVMEPVST